MHKKNIIDKYEQNLVLKSILNEYNSIIYIANQINIISNEQKKYNNCRSWWFW